MWEGGRVAHWGSLGCYSMLKEQDSKVCWGRGNYKTQYCASASSFVLLAES